MKSVARFKPILAALWLVLKRNAQCRDVRKKIVQLVSTNLFNWETEQLRTQRCDLYRTKLSAPWQYGYDYDLCEFIYLCVERFEGSARDYEGLRLQRVMMKGFVKRYFNLLPHWRWLA